MTTLTAQVDESNCWLPRRRMLKYQYAKVVGGLLIGAIFAGWLVLQWSNLGMRLFAFALLGVTAWIVIGSIAADVERARGRQLSLDSNTLTVTRPDASDTVDLTRVARGAWNEATYEDAGLWLYDDAGNALTHIDLNFLGDQDEARAFLRWARQRTELSFPIEWPST